MHTQVLDRAEGALVGLALGDALGMPTQSMSPTQIQATYGRIESLVSASADQPIAPSLEAGRVTDDTEQAIILAKQIEGGFSIRSYARQLLAWEEQMRARGSLDLLGPSTKAALQLVREGADIAKVGKEGATNGAAMRICPAGIAYRPGSELISRVQTITELTHGSSIGISGAVAVAVTVSCALEGGPLPEAIAEGVAACSRPRGNWVAGATIAARFTTFEQLSRNLSGADFTRFLREVVGTSLQSQESVVAALLIAVHYAERPFEALLEGANLGGDTDTIAAIAGAMLGAAHGSAGFPHEQVALVERINELDFAALARPLVAMREERSHG